MSKMKGYRRRARLAARQGAIYIVAPVLVAPCFYCAFWFPVLVMTEEHVENLRDGGRGLDNLRLACNGCNGSRQALSKRQKLAGLAYSKPRFSEPRIVT